MRGYQLVRRINLMEGIEGMHDWMKGGSHLEQAEDSWWAPSEEGLVVEGITEKERAELLQQSVEKLEKVLEGVVNPGSVVYIPGNNAQMKEIHQALRARLNAFDEKAEGFKPAIIYQLLSADPTLYDSDTKGKARFVTPFAGAGMRNGERNINNGGIEFIPMHLSEVPRLHLENPESEFCPDVAIVQVSPPDEYGHYSLGEGGVAISAIRGVKARGGKVIAIVNKNCPRFGGSCNITEADIDIKLTIDVPVASHGVEKEPEQWERDMAQHIVDGLRDGDILQLGIGSIPALVLRGIKEKNAKEGKPKDISIFSEVLVINKDLRDLIGMGIIPGSAFEAGPGILKCGIPLFATAEDAEWLKNENGKKYISVEPQGEMNSREKMEYMKKAGRLISINAGLCASVDGTVAAHTIGKGGETTYFSGFGGANDFNRGADVSFVCIRPTRTIKDKVTGKEEIIYNFGIKLPDGAVATYTPNDIDRLVTPGGVAELRGKPLQERLRLILGIIPEDVARNIVQDVLNPGKRNAILADTAQKWLEEHPMKPQEAVHMQMAA